jgi:hypothetical protein
VCRNNEMVCKNNEQELVSMNYEQVLTSKQTML